MVMVYFKTFEENFSSEPTLWTELPYSLAAFGSSFSYNFKYSYKAGEIKLYYYYEPNSSDSSTPNVNDAVIPDYKFKYIVASGNAIGNMKEQGIETQNHDQVVNFFNENYSSAANNVLLVN